MKVLNKIGISDKDFDEFICTFLGEEEEFMLFEPSVTIANGKIKMLGWVKNLKDNTVEKSSIEIDLTKLLNR